MGDRRNAPQSSSGGPWRIPLKQDLTRADHAATRWQSRMARDLYTAIDDDDDDRDKPSSVVISDKECDTQKQCGEELKQCSEIKEASIFRIRGLNKDRPI